ncbi:MAG TPA: diadenylate cyclase [Planctomycetota bacterium]
MRYLLWGLQILILAVGIHLFLRFVRTTRGNRLIRGLFLSVMVGVVGLWGLSRALELEELEHLLKSSTGFIVVGFVVIFQSELRRGIAQLGEHSLLGFAPAASEDAVRAAVEAARALSTARRGALIVFERETSLQSVVETGTPLDAELRAALLETLFHPETPLHDGAVVVRQDRVVAAGCILPLSEEVLPSPTMGTRHRAGLGLAEESDAVVLVVSEETGAFSLAKDGRLASDVPRDELERELGRSLRRRRSRAGESASFGAALLAALRRDLVWLPGSLLLALGIFYIAHQGLVETREFHVRFVDGSKRADKQPRPDEVLVLFDDEQSRLVEGQRAWAVEASGTRRQLEEMRGSLRGVLRIEEPGWQGGPVATRDVLWEDDGGLKYAWKAGVPELAARRFEERPFRLRADQVVLDTDAMNPRLQVTRTGLRFEPSGSVTIRGPVDELERLGDELALALETVVVSAEDREELRRRIELHEGLRARGLVLETPVVVVVPIDPVAREIGTLTREVALVCLDPSRADEQERWALPPQSQTARFSISTLGLIPEDADPASPAMVERFTSLRRFVEENLRVFVDVAELAPGGEGRSVRLRWSWKQTWRDSPEGQEAGARAARADLDVVLVSEPEILLEPRARTPRDS